MPALRKPPPRGQYRFVLRKQNSHDPTLENRVPGYDETAMTRDITHSDGIRAQTVFVRSPHFAQRLRCLGWLDVTEQWMAASWPCGANETPGSEDGPDDDLSLARKAAKVAKKSGGVESLDA